MKSVTLRFGIYSALLMIGWYIVYWGILGVRLTPENCNSQMLVSYACIVLSLAFVFFGVKYYRDVLNKHTITFGRALGVGLLITLFPSVIFGLLDMFYSRVIDTHVFETMIQVQAAQLKNTTMPADYPTKLKALQHQFELFKNPFIGWLVMFFTVAPVGLIISLISALILKRKPSVS